MKKIFNSLKIIAIAAVLAVGVSYVSAYTSPGAPSPAGSPTNNVPAPINIGALVQTKIGSLTTASYLKAGNNITPGTTGWVIAANAAGATDNGGITSLWQFFQKEYLPGIKSQMKVGSADPGRTASPLPSVDKTKFNPKDISIPLTIDLIDRGTGNNSDAGTQVMDLLAGDVCNNATTVQTNTAGVQFWSTLNNSNADVIARGIQIGDSSAGAMKVLVATDTAGNAVWGTMRIANGQVVVDYPGSSDVAAGQACGVAQVDACPNMVGVQPTVPTGMIKDGAGNCVAAPLVCPSGQYASSGQCLCNSTDMAPDAFDDMLADPLLDPIIGYFENDANGCPIPKHKVKTTVCDSALVGVAWSGIPACHQEPEPYSPAAVLIKASLVDPMRYGDADHAGERSTGCVEIRIKDLITNRAQYRYGFHAGQYEPMTPDNVNECFNWVNTGDVLEQTRYDIVPI